MSKLAIQVRPIKKEAERIMSEIATFEHTFKDTNSKVTLKKVNPFLVQEVRAALMAKKPKMPTRVVDEPGPLEGTIEEVPTEEYVEELRDYEKMIDNRVMEFQILRAIVKIHDENWQEKVAELRESFKLLGIESTLPENDTVTYVTYIASGTPSDVQELIAAIATRSAPSEEAIEAAKSTFQPNIQGQRRLVGKN